MIYQFRRSAYLFLSGLMGLLMFFILHRILVFFFLLLATASDAEFPYYKFLVWDYSTLSIALVLGGIYGLWVGRYWYKAVYHENIHNGFVDFINRKIWGESPKEVEVFQHKFEQAAEKVEEDLKNLENLTRDFPVFAKPKKVIKRSAPKSPLAKSVKAPAKRARKTKANA